MSVPNVQDKTSAAAEMTTHWCFGDGEMEQGGDYYTLALGEVERWVVGVKGSKVRIGIISNRLLARIKEHGGRETSPMKGMK